LAYIKQFCASRDYLAKKLMIPVFLTLGRTSNLIPPPWYKRGRVNRTSPLEYCVTIFKKKYLKRIACNELYKLRSILQVAELLRH